MAAESFLIAKNLVLTTFAASYTTRVRRITVNYTWFLMASENNIFTRKKYPFYVCLKTLYNTDVYKIKQIILSHM